MKKLLLVLTISMLFVSGVFASPMTIVSIRGNEVLVLDGEELQAYYQENEHLTMIMQEAPTSKR